MIKPSSSITGLRDVESLASWRTGSSPESCVSCRSKKYPGQFTDQKVAEAERDHTIFVYDKRVWDIKPDDFGNQGWFSGLRRDHDAQAQLLDPEDREVRRMKIVRWWCRSPRSSALEFEKDVINALARNCRCEHARSAPVFLGSGQGACGLQAPPVHLQSIRRGLRGAAAHAAEDSTSGTRRCHGSRIVTWR